MEKEYDAVLFDFDGTLADTMEDNFLAWKKAFRVHGAEIRREDYFPLEGMVLVEVAEIIGRKYGVDSSSSRELVNLKNRFYLEDHKFRLYPLVEEMILYAGKRKKLALVSASPREKLEKTVPGDFLKNFEVIVSGDDVSRGKPSPEPYLKAASLLSVSPERCIAVENAPLGVKSAKNAGMYCIAITTTVPESFLSEADVIVRSHEELSSILLGDSDRN